MECDIVKIAEHLKVGKENKDNCDGKCTHCNETQLPNIKDKNCDGIGYSYAYKTDCAGDRYIKIDEVRYLLKCERNKAIDDFAERLCYKIKSEIDDCSDELQWIDEIAEQLKK